MNGPNRNQSSGQAGRPRQQSSGQGGGQGNQQRRQGAPAGPNQPGTGGGRRRKRKRGGGGGGSGGGGGQQQQQQGQGNQQQQQGRSGGKDQGRHGRGQKSGKGHQRQPGRDAKPVRIQLQPDFKEIPNKHEIKRYGVIFYDTLQAAKADLERIGQQAAGYDQLNVVVRNEASMDDPDFNQMDKVKLFAGAAWTIIHERRKEEGWYDSPR